MLIEPLDEIAQVGVIGKQLLNLILARVMPDDCYTAIRSRLELKPIADLNVSFLDESDKSLLQLAESGFVFGSDLFKPDARSRLSC